MSFNMHNTSSIYSLNTDPCRGLEKTFLVPNLLAPTLGNVYKTSSYLRACLVRSKLAISSDG